MFDNIPLTALALKQGGYDWGYLAYTVGFGGSMIWFGSSAGVALSNMYPEAKSVGSWLAHGWHVAIAYVIGFFVMLAVLGWHPDRHHGERVIPHKWWSVPPQAENRNRAPRAAGASICGASRDGKNPQIGALGKGGGRCDQPLADDD